MDHPARRKAMTFAQAEGVEPLPQQLKLKEISRELRAQLWRNLYLSMAEDRERDHIGGTWEKVLLDRHVEVEYRMLDDFTCDFDEATQTIKHLVDAGNYFQVFDLLQWLMRDRLCPIDCREVQAIFEECRAAYRVVDGPTIMPIASPEEGETIRRAFADLAAQEFSSPQSI